MSLQFFSAPQETPSSGSASWFTPETLTEDHQALEGISPLPITAKPLVLVASNRTFTLTSLQWKPRFTLFRNLYVFNHTFYVVTSTPELVPLSGRVISNGADLQYGKLPTERDIAVISPEEADDMFGGTGNTIGGISFLQTDRPRLLSHSRWHNFLVGGESRELPTRYIFPRITQAQWERVQREGNWILKAALGPVAMRFKDDWDAQMTGSDVLVLKHAILADITARRSDHDDQSYRTHGAAFPLSTHPGWWESIRARVVSDALGSSLVVAPNYQENRYQVTYIYRQRAGRRLRQRDHSRLIDALRHLCDSRGYHLVVLEADKTRLVEQIQILSRTTVVVGVHGNDLSGQLWLPPTSRSTVIEIFVPGGFVYDYEYCSRVLGHKHYGIWNDRYFTAPDLPQGDHDIMFPSVIQD
ncbi:hypothetical protein FRC17_001524 [Serendipita sp. 399]|nr:hypothetical protein FRC17_001524 [Serendipita sp. 399]